MSAFFLDVYKAFIKPEWKTLDILEHIEEYNYKILQAGEASELAGKFNCTRIDPFNLQIIYKSPRKMCPVLVGLIKGLAIHYHEQTSIKQTQCVLEGDNACLFHISLIVSPQEKRKILK